MTYISYSADVRDMNMQSPVPVESSLWWLEHNGETNAHYAASHNKLPKGFVGHYRDTLFIQRGVNGTTPAHYYASFNILPLNFPHWSIMNDDGYTIAHWAALNGTLPDGFVEKYRDTLFIQRATGTGITPAHLYVIKNELPLDFPHWGLKDHDGYPIAHYAAMYGNLPLGFAEQYSDLWNNVADHQGNTVKDMASWYFSTKPSGG